MSAKHSTIPAATYLRRSTDRQEASIDRQRESVLAYAAQHGYEIVREYKDEGISGDATEKRADFLRMREDASRGDFRIILCWDKDRFGRFDSIEQGYWVKPIRDAGVQLVTVTEGVIDWSTFAGRIVDSVRAEGKHQFLTSLSKNTAAGKVRNARLKYFNGGTVPYAFDRMLLDERDRPVRRLCRGEKTDKPRGWHTVLVPVEDAEEIAVARWLFHSFLDRHVSYRALANELNARGVPGPGSKEKGRRTLWGRQTVIATLANGHYAGHAIFGRVNHGKYCRVQGGEVREVSFVPKTKAGNPRKQVNTERLIVMADAHEAIIDPSLWQRVQDKMAARRRDKEHPRGSGYPLAGLVRCGHCGKAMHGCTNRYKSRPGKNVYRRYVCSSWNLNGPSTCGYHAVREDRLLPFLVRKLQEDYLAPGRLARLAQKLRARIKERQRPDPRPLEKLRIRLVQLDADIRQSAQNVLRAGSNLDVLNEALTQQRRERDRLGRELEAAERAAGRKPVEIESQVEAALEVLSRLGERIANAKADELREVLGQMVTGIDLYFEEIPKRQRTYHRLVKGVCRLRPQVSGLNIKECQACERKTSSMRRTPRCHRNGAICRRVTSGPASEPAS